MSDVFAALPKVPHEVVAWIVRYIADHDLHNGDKLPSEHQLCALTRAGRSSVREALRLLVGKGRIEVRAGKGYYVQSSDPSPSRGGSVSLGVEEIRELTEARLVLECECAALAAVRATSDDVAQIERLLDAMEAKARSGVDVYTDTIRLHLLIADAAHNRAFSEMMQVIMPRLSAHGAEIAKEIPDRAELDAAIHRELWSQIRSGDSENARIAMATHIRDSASVYRLPYESKSMSESPERLLP